MRLLLVEDDPMIGETLLDVLRAEHYAVDWVKDGEVADMALRAQQYDLVLLDLGLPDRDGLSVIRDIRARGAKLMPTCPFVRGWIDEHPDQQDLVA